MIGWDAATPGQQHAALFRRIDEANGYIGRGDAIGRAWTAVRDRLIDAVDRLDGPHPMTRVEWIAVNDRIRALRIEPAKPRLDFAGNVIDEPAMLRAIANIDWSQTPDD